MEMRQLRYLLAVAETGNFTRAAEQVFVSQSALSQQIQALEQETGALLLERSKRGARLTAAGEILARHAARIMLELEQAEVGLRELEGLQRGELRVGVVQTVNAYFLPTVLSRFASHYPDIRLQIDELPSDDIEARLDSGTLQVGIGFAPPTLPDIAFEALFEEELVLVLRADHALAGVRSIPVAELDAIPLILLAKTFCTRRLWEENARLAGAQPKVVMELTTVSGILAVVAKTGLPTILPRQILEDALNDGFVAVGLHNPVPSRQVGLLWKQDRTLCAASRAFIDITRTISENVLQTAEI